MAVDNLFMSQIVVGHINLFRVSYLGKLFNIPKPISGGLKNFIFVFL